MKKAKLIYTGKTDKLVPIFAKLVKDIDKNYKEEINQGKILLNFDKEDELILEVRNDNELVEGFIDGFNKGRTKAERWVLARSGVHTKLEIED